jgi:hypothetical protein
VTLIVARPQLVPESFERSVLHSDDRIWAEKNCYVDVWISVVHAARLAPMAMMSFTIAVDFEGDQWTFYKPAHTEITDLYGIDVQELTVWKPLLDHVIEHVGAGKLVSTEADAFFLSDTAGTDYRRNHVKTSIVIAAIDVEHRRCAYFHNAGMFWLEGDDFAQTFRLDVPHDPLFLPLYAEVMRLDRMVHRDRATLQQMAMTHLARYARRRPASNPVLRFAERFNNDLPWLQSAGLGTYHAWAFATTRQMGSAFELAGLHLDWLRDACNEQQAAHLSEASAALLTISAGAKAFILKAARAVNNKKHFDASEPFAHWAQQWQRAMDAIDAVVVAP